MSKVRQTSLTAQDRAAIAAAIGKAEATTAGEVYCVVARNSGDYHAVPLLIGGLAMVVVPLGLVLAGADFTRLLPGLSFGGWSGWSETDALVRGGLTAVVDTVVVQILIWLVVLLASINPAVRRFLTPGFIKRRAVHKHAMEQFLGHGMTGTSGHTGVLIFISLAENLAEIIADKGINDHVEPETWGVVLDGLLSKAAGGDLTGGLVHAVEETGTILSRHVPRLDGDVDELPNRVVEI
jgi:putative membrane protein